MYREKVKHKNVAMTSGESLHEERGYDSLMADYQSHAEVGKQAAGHREDFGFDTTRFDTTPSMWRPKEASYLTCRRSGFYALPLLPMRMLGITTP